VQSYNNFEIECIGETKEILNHHELIRCNRYIVETQYFASPLMKIFNT